MKKRWIDIPNEDIKAFLFMELKCKSVSDIRRHPKNDNITCDIITTRDIGGEDIDIKDNILLSPYDIDAEFDVSGLDYKWQQYLTAKGFHPLQIDNPYMKKESL